VFLSSRRPSYYNHDLEYEKIFMTLMLFFHKRIWFAEDDTHTNKNSLSISYTHSVLLSHTHTQSSLSHTHTLIHTLSFLSHTHTLLHTLSFLSQTHTYTHTLFSLTHTLNVYLLNQILDLKYPQIHSVDDSEVKYIDVHKTNNNQESISSMLNVRIFCMSVRFGRFYYVHVTRKSCQNDGRTKNACVLR